MQTGLVEPARAHRSLESYVRLPLARHGHVPLLTRMFELRDNFTASDAAYVALSERLDATLVTCDGRLTRAVQTLLTVNVVGVTG